MSAKKHKHNSIFFFFPFVASLAIIVLLFSSFVTENVKIEEKIPDGNFPQDYKIISPKLPDQLSFCGENVPLQNIDVKERLDREIIVNTYWHSLSILSMKRANRWFPVIEPILKQYNVPDDFKYLSLTESILTNITSPAGAVGFWQFKKEAAREYGLEINKEIDERYNVKKATAAACKFLLDSYKKYGSWTLAAASYNFGKSGIDEQLTRQETSNYYNLVLPEETSRYIFRILAIKEVLENPAKYGFHLDPEDLYPPYQTFEIEINTKIPNWAKFAKEKGINYKILKMLNPWLRESFLTNRKHKTYKIELPVPGSIYVIPN